jgi:hypothetical protein
VFFSTSVVIPKTLAALNIIVKFGTSTYAYLFRSTIAILHTDMLRVLNTKLDLSKNFVSQPLSKLSPQMTNVIRSLFSLASPLRLAMEN